MTFVPSPGNVAVHPAARAPVINLPAGSCDSHCHVFGPSDRFPYAANRTFTPVDAPLEELQALHKRLGIDRAVIVQSACYGSDNRILLDALKRGADAYRGVALISPATSSAAIAELHAAGVRGFRLNFLPHLGGPTGPDELDRMVNLVRDLDWHAEIHVHDEEIASYAEFIGRLPIRAVIDHMARVDLRRGGDSPAVHALLALLDTGRVWVKTSGSDRLSLTGPPYLDAVALAARLVAHAPERALWGTDFPHPNISGSAPDDGLLTDLIDTIAPSVEIRQRLLVTNPTEFFDFG
jgi:2-pyrone-4,6-dicarboxylate lactonase